MKKRIVSIMLILVGLGLICYPKAAEMYYEYEQKQLIKKWEQSMQMIHNGDDDEEYVESQTIDTNKGNLIETDEDTELTDEEVDVTGYFSEHEQMEGLLMIDKIDLTLPILRGLSERNMKTTVASMIETSRPGEIGNFAIAGHRNFTYGRNFNRLDEIETGDMIDVHDGEQQYQYEVVEKLYVLPEEVWVLEGNETDKEITLITCHPMKDPTHRLIIKGKIIES